MPTSLVRLASAVLFVAAVLSPLPALSSGKDAGTGQQTHAGSLPAGVLDVVWEWTWFGSGAEQFDVENPEQYTVQFFDNGSLALQADCNRGRGEYMIDAEGMITLAKLATTMMLCEGDSRADQFLQALEQARLFFEQEGDFFLEAPIDSGTLRFRRAAD